MTTDGCVICGHSPTDGAHVKPKDTFSEKERSEGFDRVQNIIQLCQNHHRLFDRGRIGICPRKGRVVIDDPNSDIGNKNLRRKINIAEKYVEFRNSTCKYRVKFKLGILPQSYGSLCDGR